MIQRFQSLALLIAGWLMAFSAQAQETGAAAKWWPQFRGPNALSIAPDGKKLPVQFGPEQSLLWKTPLPPGLSSP